jgi:hypothetical protein
MKIPVKMRRKVITHFHHWKFELNLAVDYNDAQLML